MLQAHTAPATTPPPPLHVRGPAPASCETRRPAAQPDSWQVPRQARHDCFICKLRQSWLVSDPFSRHGTHPAEPLKARQVIKRGGALFKVGDPFTSLYAVHTGQFKTSTLTPDGRTQVTGFHIAGELLGLDGIGSGMHSCDATALEDAQVCSLSHEELNRMLTGSPTLQRQFWQIMSDQIVHDQHVMFWLGNLKAEERVASFLINLSRRLQGIGHSASALVLRMSRQEIGSYLGLTLETVSRGFSKLHQQRVLEVKERDVRILDRDRLVQMGCRA